MVQGLARHRRIERARRVYAHVQWPDEVDAVKGLGDFFERAVFAILAAGSVYAMGYFVAVFADNLVRIYTVVIAVFLVGGNNLKRAINNYKRVWKKPDNIFTAGF